MSRVPTVTVNKKYKMDDRPEKKNLILWPATDLHSQTRNSLGSAGNVLCTLRVNTLQCVSSLRRLRPCLFKKHLLGGARILPRQHSPDGRTSSADSARAAQPSTPPSSSHPISPEYTALPIRPGYKQNVTSQVWSKSN
ncbi:unnamed protein product [Macrosiphum euphorbiae]|uniref:Uncharacterized protein n=1 Tax=Macrosiphum euphorbiae TaxID=13131 RepID=A0AAV0X6D2_9HEMI|nr:unnamed protein product [Macrosiphum euphorbiae]